MSIRHAALAALLTLSTPAFASRPECPCESERATLKGFRDQLAAAESPDAAKEMALDQTRLGHVAIARVAKAMPNNRELQAANDRLTAFEAGIDAAVTQGEVAHQFDQLMASPSAGTGCSYTTTEVVIVIIGFVLGVLPGILFLFLF